MCLKAILLELCAGPEIMKEETAQMKLQERTTFLLVALTFCFCGAARKPNGGRTYILCLRVDANKFGR